MEALPSALSLIRDGLPKTARPKTVVIVGAGMAGLVAAYELLRAGHNPVVLEARPRPGGRVHTLREPFLPGLWGEAGAMRIPKSHDLTLAYVEKWGLSVSPFTMGNPKAYLHLQGRSMRFEEVAADPSRVAEGFAAHEAGKTCDSLWQEALAPFAARLAQKGPDPWAEIVAEYDGYSTREFLESRGWSEAAIELFGLLQNQEALMNSSFLELLREELGECYTNMVQIDGGMDRLPGAFLPDLRRHVRFGAKMLALDQTETGVTVHYQASCLPRASITADYAIVTVPFPVLRHVEFVKPLSAGKRRAIRQLRYDASAKIFFQCRRRFWEEDDGIVGGGSVTDLPVRNVYYPEHGRETGRGVLLASYTWSEDAQRWGSLPEEARIAQALENVSCIHPQVTDEFEAGASKMWHDDEFAGGAFALFDPGQQTLLHRHIVAPEGRIHFAGEHASLHHAWIQGAIESGLRAAYDICQGAAAG
jgi:monoamine oxidase